jgi:hypothetical protein
MFYGVAFRAARPLTLLPDRPELSVRVSQVRGGRLLAAMGFRGVPRSVELCSYSSVGVAVDLVGSDEVENAVRA